MKLAAALFWRKANNDDVAGSGFRRAAWICTSVREPVNFVEMGGNLLQRATHPIYSKRTLERLSGRGGASPQGCTDQAEARKHQSPG